MKSTDPAAVWEPVMKRQDSRPTWLLLVISREALRVNSQQPEKGNHASITSVFTWPMGTHTTTCLSKAT